MNDYSSAPSIRDLPVTATRQVSTFGRLIGGCVVAVLFMGSTLLTPLYDLYSTAYRLSVLGLGVLYAVYVIGNLVALLFFGRLSDQVGRRPIALASLALAALSTFLFLFARGPTWLFAARIISGLGVGLGSGAATAWITEFTPEAKRTSAASMMTAFNFAGLALGVMSAGLLVQYEPHPLRLPFEMYLVLLTVLALFVARTPETLRARSQIDLKPRLGVPSGARLPFIAPAAGGFAAMAIVGFYAALGPTTLKHSLHVVNSALSGAVVAELFVVAALVIVATRHLTARATMMIGLMTIPIGVVLLVVAQRYGSLTIMLLSASFCGLSAALAYRGGLAVAGTLTPPERRAEVASSYFVCCFIGNALPIIGVAALTKFNGADVASLVFAGVLSIISVAALVAARFALSARS